MTGAIKQEPLEPYQDPKGAFFKNKTKILL